MSLIKNEVAVMFSGGIDSLLASVLLQKDYDKVHLVTFDKGYLEFGVKNNLPNVERLKATYGPDRITHRVIDLKAVHKQISVSSFFKDRKNYNTETRWCVGCRLSMNVGGLLFALENNLVGYADGSNPVRGQPDRHGRELSADRQRIKKIRPGIRRSFSDADV
jgi:tRNA U34 2-thiouridine synthase MnmA/TrmU